MCFFRLMAMDGVLKSAFTLSIALIALAALPAHTQTRELESVRMHEAPDYTRVVFDISAAVQYEMFTLDNPRRVVIDLSDTRAAPGFDGNLAGESQDRVKQLRGSPRGTGYRVVLDLNMALQPKSFTLDPVAPYGHRLVLDLYQSGVAREEQKVVPKPDGRRDVVIAIDAGHGGEDPGAIGPDGIREKDVVMKIADRLKRKVDAAEGFQAVLVRRGDYYLAHRERMAVARRARADLFISIHADAFKSRDVSGASVFVLSDHGATSESARWLAEKENASDLIGGVGNVSLDDKDDLVRKVIMDLSMDANRASSIEVGEAIVGQLGEIGRLHKKRVEQAGFLVLKSPDIPSVLVETGFISNPPEARRLNSSAYQEKVAHALFVGLRDYLALRAPEGTLVAWRREQGDQRHTVGRGDTLSGIAVRYGTSARRIKEVNGMHSDVIRLGQVITIPAG
ncbi:MAG: N-acetylmuramoyl-L-alanine amidase [Pseudomonadales bacterium]